MGHALQVGQAELALGSVPRVGTKKRGTEVETGDGDFPFDGARATLPEQLMLGSLKGNKVEAESEEACQEYGGS